MFLSYIFENPLNALELLRINHIIIEMSFKKLNYNINILKKKISYWNDGQISSLLGLRRQEPPLFMNI